MPVNHIIKLAEIVKLKEIVKLRIMILANVTSLVKTCDTVSSYLIYLLWRAAAASWTAAALRLILSLARAPPKPNLPGS